MVGQKAFAPKMFYQLSLDQLVPADDFYRRLDRVLDVSFVRDACRPYYGTTGNPSLDPEVFFKIVLVGYLENIVSDRELARRIRDSLALRWFLRYDLDEATPWHSTISRTRQRLPVAVFTQVFEAVLTVCVAHNLVQGEHVAVDTTLIKANAALDSLERKQPAYSVPEYLEQVHALNAPATRRTNATHRSRRDPDARIATKPGKPVALYYKETLAVDPKHGMILHADAVHADMNDSQTLVPTVVAVQRRLAAHGYRLASLSADKAYCVGGVLHALEPLGVEAYIPLVKRTHKPQPWGLDRFIYDAARDAYRCPAGAWLPFKTSNGRSKRYRAAARDCQNCRFRTDCVPQGGTRLLFHPVYKAQFEALAHRQATAQGRRAARWRKAAERAFSELVTTLGLRKMNTLGLAQARKQCLLAAVAYNLKKFLRYGYPYAAAPGGFAWRPAAPPIAAQNGAFFRFLVQGDRNMGLAT